MSFKRCACANREYPSLSCPVHAEKARRSLSPTGRDIEPPVLQPLPLRTELAKRVQEVFRAEIPQPLVQVDFSDLELRVLAELGLD